MGSPAAVPIGMGSAEVDEISASTSAAVGSFLDTRISLRFRRTRAALSENSRASADIRERLRAAASVKPGDRKSGAEENSQGHVDRETRIFRFLSKNEIAVPADRTGPTVVTYRSIL